MKVTDQIQAIKSINSLININKIPNVDLELSIKLAGGKSKLANDLLGMMIKSLPTEKKLINSAYKVKNFAALQEHVHKLHGACCYTGFSRLKYLCHILEQALILQNHNIIAEAIEFINQEINFLLDNYTNLIQS